MTTLIRNETVYKTLAFFIYGGLLYSWPKMDAGEKLECNVLACKAAASANKMCKYYLEFI